MTPRSCVSHTSQMESNLYYELLHKLLPRYVRIRDPSRTAEYLEKLKRLAGSEDVFEVNWLPGFFCLPGSLPISTWKPIENGFYPMDIASALAVVELFNSNSSSSSSSSSSCSSPSPSEYSIKALDLCCCPGSKFQMISDELEIRNPSVDCKQLVVGVDIAQHRMQTCKRLVGKWRVGRQSSELELSNTGNAAASQIACANASMPPRQLLFLEDGRTFGNSASISYSVAVADTCSGSAAVSDKPLPHTLVYDSTWAQKEDAFQGARKRANKSSRHREATHLRAEETALRLAGELAGGFDLVLVDAECSHDGSYRHMRYVDNPEAGNSNDPDSALGSVIAATTEGSPGDNGSGEQNTACDVDVQLESMQSEASLPDSRGGALTASMANKRACIRPIDDSAGATLASVMTSGGSGGDNDDTVSVSILAPNITKSTASRQYHDPDRPEALQSLQRGLIDNGYRKLRVGCTMVYSTCSFEAAQNEDIVRWLLNTYPSARLVPCFIAPTTVLAPVTTLSTHSVCLSSAEQTIDECGLASGATATASSTATIRSISGEASTEELLRLKSPPGHHNGKSAEEVLRLQPGAFESMTKTLSEDQLFQLSVDICRFISQLDRPPAESGSLQGTLRLSKSVGMSGLFVAKIMKVPV